MRFSKLIWYVAFVRSVLQEVESYSVEDERIIPRVVKWSEFYLCFIDMSFMTYQASHRGDSLRTAISKTYSRGKFAGFYQVSKFFPLPSFIYPPRDFFTSCFPFTTAVLLLITHVFTRVSFPGPGSSLPPQVPFSSSRVLSSKILQSATVSQQELPDS